MANFIYVFSEQERDMLLNKQYEMLRCDEQNRIYVFLNKEQQHFDCENIAYVLSDTLTF